MWQRGGASPALSDVWYLYMVRAAVCDQSPVTVSHDSLRSSSGSNRLDGLIFLIAVRSIEAFDFLNCYMHPPLGI